MSALILYRATSIWSFNPTVKALRQWMWRNLTILIFWRSVGHFSSKIVNFSFMVKMLNFDNFYDDQLAIFRLNFVQNCEFHFLSKMLNFAILCIFLVQNELLVSLNMNHLQQVLLYKCSTYNQRCNGSGMPGYAIPWLFPWRGCMTTILLKSMKYYKFTMIFNVLRIVFCKC